jgi:hypothetical protein
MYDSFHFSYIITFTNADIVNFSSQIINEGTGDRKGEMA